MEKLVTVRLDDEAAKALDREARRTNRSRSLIIREALAARFAMRPSDARTALAKYAGSMSGPSDLSTNKQHLAGLGRRGR
jgi:predicted transcriptional regulator